MKPVLIIFCCQLISFLGKAQIDHYHFGARAVGIGNASVTLQDAWSLFNNVGALSKTRDPTILSAYDNRFGMKEFQTFGLGFVSPLQKHGTFGISISRFGDEIYSEQKIGLAYSHHIENVSLGIKVNYLQVNIQDLGSSKTFVFEFGGSAKIIPQLIFAAHIYNFSLARLQSQYEDEKVPVILKAGLSYQPIKSLLINVETEKQVDQPVSFKTGIEYMVIKDFYFRTGIQTQPFRQFFGLGFNPKHFCFDYALAYNQKTGLSHHVSFGYTFLK